MPDYVRTYSELRAHPEYKVCMDKIKAYRPGFILGMDYTEIPAAKGNALKIILRDAVKNGYLESISIEVGLDGVPTGENYRRTNKI